MPLSSCLDWSAKKEVQAIAWTSKGYIQFVNYRG